MRVSITVSVTSLAEDIADHQEHGDRTKYVAAAALVAYYWIVKDGRGSNFAYKRVKSEVLLLVEASTVKHICAWVRKAATSERYAEILRRTDPIEAVDAIRSALRGRRWNDVRSEFAEAGGGGGRPASETYVFNLLQTRNSSSYELFLIAQYCLTELTTRGKGDTVKQLFRLIGLSK